MTVGSLPSHWMKWRHSTALPYVTDLDAALVPLREQVARLGGAVANVGGGGWRGRSTPQAWPPSPRIASR